MTSKSPARSAEDVDESVLNYAQIKALAAGDPKIKEKIDLEIEVNRLQTLYGSYQEEKRRMQRNISEELPRYISFDEALILGYEADMNYLKENASENFSGMTVGEVFYSEKKEAGEAILNKLKDVLPDRDEPFGNYRGFAITVAFDKTSGNYKANLKRNMSYSVVLGSDVYGNITRLDNLLKDIPQKYEKAKSDLDALENQLAFAKDEINKPFPRLDELREKEERLEILNREFTEGSADTQSTETKSEPSKENNIEI